MSASGCDLARLRGYRSPQLSALVFFALAIGTYVIHGLLQDTDNQLRRPHRVGKRLLPPWLTGLFMGSLIVGEVAGTLVLGTGAMLGIWNG